MDLSLSLILALDGNESAWTIDHRSFFSVAQNIKCLVCSNATGWKESHQSLCHMKKRVECCVMHILCPLLFRRQHFTAISGRLAMIFTVTKLLSFFYLQIMSRSRLLSCHLMSHSPVNLSTNPIIWKVKTSSSPRYQNGDVVSKNE